MKKLGFWSILLLTINSIIGTGIFLSPGIVAKEIESLTPVVYIIASIFSIIFATVFASSSRYVNKGGAAYAYAKSAFGENVGLYVGITKVIANSISWAVLSVAIIKVSFSIFNIPENNNYMLLSLFFLMFFILIINSISLNFINILNNISSILKLIILGITILAGIYILINKNIDLTLHKNILIKETSISSIVSSIIIAFYAFSGFEDVASGSIDMQNPEKNLPYAIPLATTIVCFIYFSIVFIAMKINSKVLIFSNDTIVLANIFENISLKNTIIIGAFLSMFGINIATSFHIPRILEAIAIENQLPTFLTKRTKNNFPINSFLITAIFTIFISITFNYDISKIIVVSSLSIFIQFIIVPISLIYFYLGKNKEKVLKTNKNFITDIIIPILALIITTFLLYNFNWIEEFSIKSNNGDMKLNIQAIISMILSFIIIPLSLKIYTKK